MANQAKYEIPIGLRRIINNMEKTVAESYNVSLEDLHSPVRTRTIADARFVCQFLMHKYYGLGQAVTGLRFGRRNHATVLHSSRAISNLIETDHEAKLRLIKLFHDCGLDDNEINELLKLN